MAELVEVGRVRKVHGLRGELKFVFDHTYGDDVAVGTFLFIGDDEATALPYEVTSLRGADFILGFEGVSCKEECASLAGKKAYLRDQDVTDRQPEKKNDEEKYDRLIGFTVVDDELGVIGVIESTERYPQQILATVKRTKKQSDVLVPLNPDLIKGVDFTRQIVFMILPEGILDL